MEHGTDEEVRKMFKDLLRETDALGLTPWGQGFLDSVSHYDEEVRKMFKDLLRETDALGLTPWEQGFLDSVSRYKDFSKLSTKQKNVLIKLFDKYFKE